MVQLLLPDRFNFARCTNIRLEEELDPPELPLFLRRMRYGDSVELERGSLDFDVDGGVALLSCVACSSVGSLGFGEGELSDCWQPILVVVVVFNQFWLSSASCYK